METEPKNRVHDHDDHGSDAFVFVFCVGVQYFDHTHDEVEKGAAFRFLPLIKALSPSPRVLDEFRHGFSMIFPSSGTTSPA